MAYNADHNEREAASCSPVLRSAGGSAGTSLAEAWNRTVGKEVKLDLAVASTKPSLSRNHNPTGAERWIKRIPLTFDSLKAKEGVGRRFIHVQSAQKEAHGGQKRLEVRWLFFAGKQPKLCRWQLLGTCQKAGKLASAD